MQSFFENDDYIVQTNVARQLLENQHECCNTHGLSQNNADLIKHEPIIVSLTSFPARIKTVYKTIESMYNQTMKPNEICLWLSKDQFGNNYSLPDNLTYCLQKGLKVIWVKDDLKAHKKYLYAMEQYRNSVIITIDDDIIYSPTRIQELYEAHIKYPKAVIGAHVHIIGFSPAGKILPYNQWISGSRDYIDFPSMALLAVGCGGVLYPPHIFSKYYNDILAIKNTCIYADDIWLKFIEVMHGIPVVASKSDKSTDTTIDGTQENALWRYNTGDEKGNDIQIQKALEYIESVYGNNTVLHSIYTGYQSMYISEDQLRNDIIMRSQKKPTISIIIPVYNVSKYLEAFLSSLTIAVERTDISTEVIIVDDGSTDGSDNLLIKFAEAHDYVSVIWQTNHGAWHARNIGLDAARGEYIMFCDPDDWVDSLIIDKLYYKAIHEKSDLVLCGRMLYDENKHAFMGANVYDSDLLVKYPHGFSSQDVVTQIFDFCQMPWGKIIKKELLDKYSIRFPNLPRNEDVSFSNSVLLVSRNISIVNDPLYVYRRNVPTSLQSGVEKSPYSIVEACLCTRDFINKHSDYALYEQAFLKFVFVENVQRTASLLSNWTICEEFYSRFKNEFFETFNLSRLNTDLLDKSMRRVYTVIQRGGSLKAFIRVLPQEKTVTYNAHDEATMLRASISYRIGRAITFIPRKIRGGIRCYKEHGMQYTIYRAKEKVLNKFRSIAHT